MIKGLRKFSKLALVFLFVECLFSQQKGKINIAVLDFNTQGGLTPDESVVISNRLRTLLTMTEVYNVLERGKMNEILQEQGFQLSGCTSDECAVEAGRLLPVQQIIAGNIGKLGRVYTVDIRLIDLETGKILKTLGRNYQGEIEGLLDLLGDLANEMAGTNVKFDKIATVKKEPQYIPQQVTDTTPLQMPYYQPEKKSGGKILLWGGAIALIGGGIYYYLNSQKATPAEQGFPKPPGRPQIKIVFSR